MATIKFVPPEPVPPKVQIILTLDELKDLNLLLCKAKTAGYLDQVSYSYAPRVVTVKQNIAEFLVAHAKGGVSHG